MVTDSPLFIGVDLGTSGCRMVVVSADGQNIASVMEELPHSQIIDGHRCQQPADWWNAIENLFKITLTQINPELVKSIAINGTSGSVLLIDDKGMPISPCYMYNDDANAATANKISLIAPENSAVHGPSSGLAKCLTLLEEYKNKNIYRCITQADWVAGKIANDFDFSDENNSLKMGYDPLKHQWPKWLEQFNCLKYLPSKVYEPGSPVGNIEKNFASKYGLASDTKIIAGTTDSIAAFIATGSEKIGDAVTSLGSTLSIKLINDKPIFAPQFGVYSHRLGDTWLVGGASNTGGAAILQHFNQAEIDLLSNNIDPEKITGLDYYPLTSVGERFPINDPALTPRISPRPTDDLLFFQGILEGIARIEKQAYDKLHELGAVYPTQITTMGGGSRNSVWLKIREYFCHCPVVKAKQADAAYGSAILARNGYLKSKN